MSNSNDGMVWKNPCPDASVPTSPSGAFVTFIVGGPRVFVPGPGSLLSDPFVPGPGSLLSDPGIRSGAAQPAASISYVIHKTGGFPKWNAIPTTAPLPDNTIDSNLDAIRTEFDLLTKAQSDSNRKLIEQNNEISDLKTQLEWFKKLVADAEDKFAKIKAHL